MFREWLDILAYLDSDIEFPSVKAFGDVFVVATPEGEVKFIQARADNHCL